MSTPMDQVSELDTLLDALGIDDATMRELVSTSMRQKRTANAGAAGAKGKFERQFRALRMRAEQSERMIDALLGKLEALACALGACPECWGEDPDCQSCGGIGTCGQFLPDQACFENYVVPVLKRVQRSKRNAIPDTADMRYAPAPQESTTENKDHE